MTGAAGFIGTVLRAGLRGRVERLRLLDVVTMDDLATHEEYVACDITDVRQVRAAIDGVDGVVHLAAISDEVTFDELFELNVAGTQRVLDAARYAGVRRVVFASTNHVTGMYRADETVDVPDPVRPDGFYAVSKVAGEALGRLYADKHGIEFVAIRIGSCLAAPTEPRHRHTWLSPTDAVAAFWAAMTAPCDGFALFYGVSANGARWWPLTAGMALGYHPRDDADSHLQPDPLYAGRQGGDFAVTDPDRDAGTDPGTGHAPSD